MILLTLRDRKRLKWSRTSSADMLGIGDLRWKYESMHEACNCCDSNKKRDDASYDDDGLLNSNAPLLGEMLISLTKSNDSLTFFLQSCYVAKTRHVVLTANCNFLFVMEKVLPKL